jgi:creatinine amidohydrolase/Fe(II)-dependent formamide hydrolase-like protein
MPIDFGKTSADQLRLLSPLTTVFFFPVGALEDHGPHLPMALDVMEAEKLCWMAAEKLESEMKGWTGVVLPAAPISISTNTRKLALFTRGYVLRDWLIDSCKALSRGGFRYFICFTGHLGPRQLTAIEDAGKMIAFQGPFTILRRLFSPKGDPRSVKPILISASSALTNPAQMREAPLWPDPREHGGKRDTAVARHLGVAIGEPGAANPRPPSRWARTVARFTGQTAGYWGDAAPSDAEPAMGETLLKATIDDVFPKIRALLEGGRPGSMFRSWYSVLPPNQSFFKAWLLVTMTFAIVVLWVIFVMQGVGTIK